jgi:hypothetical protein
MVIFASFSTSFMPPALPPAGMEKAGAAAPAAGAAAGAAAAGALGLSLSCIFPAIFKTSLKNSLVLQDLYNLVELSLRPAELAVDIVEGELSACLLDEADELLFLIVADIFELPALCDLLVINGPGDAIYYGMPDFD